MEQGKRQAPPADAELGGRIYEGSLIIELLRLRDAMRLFFRPVLRRHALSDQNWRILKVLGERGPTDMTALGLGAVIPPASASRMVSRMEASGLLRRRADRNDGRLVLVDLTAKGWRLYERAAPEIRRTYVELSAMLPPDALAQLDAAVRHLNAAIAAIAPGDGTPEP